jgi:hypothetical protein
MCTAFFERRFIKIKRAVAGAAQAVIYLAGNPRHDGASIPARMGQKMLQNLIVGVGHHLGHPFHVAFASLKQSRQILRGWREDAMVTGTQQILKAKKEGRERLAQVR